MCTLPRGTALSMAPPKGAALTDSEKQRATRLTLMDIFVARRLIQASAWQTVAPGTPGRTGMPPSQIGRRGAVWRILGSASGTPLGSRSKIPGGPAEERTRCQKDDEEEEEKESRGEEE